MNQILLFLAFLVVYIAVCYAGRYLLRSIRRNQDIFLYLRNCQETTKVGLLITGFFSAILLGISLPLAAMSLAEYLPWMWYLLLIVSIAVTLLLVLLHYTEVDYVQLVVFFLVAAVLLLGLFTVIAVDAPKPIQLLLTKHLQQHQPISGLINKQHERNFDIIEKEEIIGNI